MLWLLEAKELEPIVSFLKMVSKQTATRRADL